MTGPAVFIRRRTPVEALHLATPATISGFGFQARPRSWRAPRDGGYHPTVSMPEPTTSPQGPAGASR